MNVTDHRTAMAYAHNLQQLAAVLNAAAMNVAAFGLSDAQRAGVAIAVTLTPPGSEQRYRVELDIDTATGQPRCTVKPLYSTPPNAQG